MIQETKQEQAVIHVNLINNDAFPYIDFLIRHGCELYQGMHRHYQVVLPPGTTVEPYQPIAGKVENTEYSKITLPDGTSFIEWYSREATFGFLYGNPFE
jgi:hypothetical protein